MWSVLRVSWWPNTLPDAVPREGSSLCLGSWSSFSPAAHLGCETLDATSAANVAEKSSVSSFSCFPTGSIQSVVTSNIEPEPRHAFFPDIQRRMRQPELFPICFRALSWACSRSLLPPPVSFFSVLFRAIWMEDCRLVEAGHMIKEYQNVWKSLESQCMAWVLWRDRIWVTIVHGE